MYRQDFPAIMRYVQLSVPHAGNDWLTEAGQAAYAKSVPRAGNDWLTDAGQAADAKSVPHAGSTCASCFVQRKHWPLSAILSRLKSSSVFISRAAMRFSPS